MLSQLTFVLGLSKQKVGKMPVIDTDTEILRILKESRKIAVVGISRDPLKAGYYVPKVLKEKGFQLFGVNPKYAGEKILGIEVYGSLKEIKGEIDIVLIFRPPKDVPEAAEEALGKGFKTFWMQPGTVNEETKKELHEKGFNVVSGRCIKVETERLLNGR